MSHTGNVVGILLPSKQLRRIRAGLVTKEHEKLYFRFGKQLGLKPVLFDLCGLHLKKQRITGYIWEPSSSRYIRVHRPLPPVIHSRVLKHSQKLTRLSRIMGKRLFNPPVRRDKGLIHRLLSKNHMVRDHQPATIRLKNATKAVAWIHKHPVVFIKPAVGSLGRHIIRVERMRAGSFRVHPYKKRSMQMSSPQLFQYVKTIRKKGRPYLSSAGNTLSPLQRGPL
ncbi:MAG: hypothetical protein M0Z65_12600 [Firmicutes bacterium]|nr:hypothetical protein [Bacillota bacterium]